ncbi:PilZ domain-containing protein [Desulfonema ishimotonii]|uniref:PilZ domain-containing protein n=1 Tax=Desulfonema ishimotonii TaxID=45657 RepID=A0A401G0L3_9BACT|nr:PilZ domain-containing protein [Desulfonema ishimotonii]GBC62765.1 PilZ domain-containing protein [Desulfonema ishimotonii]
MKQEKAFVHDDCVAVITCPDCHIARRVDVRRYRNIRQSVRLKCRCGCGCRFNITLERRQSFRKEVFLSGQFLPENGSQKLLMTIKDISKSGIAFRLSRQTDFSIRDRGVVEFHLDDMTHTLVRKTVEIRSVSGLSIGAVFCPPDPAEWVDTGDRELGNYLLACPRKKPKWYHP